MASLRIPVLRHLTSCQARSLRASNQRRWAQVHDVRFLATTQHRRAVVEKYRQKLDRKAREEGLRDLDELKAAYADKIDDLRRKTAASIPHPAAGATALHADAQPSAEEALQRPPSHLPADASTPPKDQAVKPLSAILDLDKVRTLPDKELTAIWRLRHATTPTSLCATIPASTYAAMEAAARRNPHFVLPVPHEGQGAELHFLQWTFSPDTRTSTVLFTQLAEFKARGEFAQPHTTVTHHTDLADERGLVLMQGQVVEGRGVRVEHAQWLAVCLQKFYGGVAVSGGEDAGPAALERAVERSRLLEWFAAGDERFSVEKLMEEAERLG
jgi:ATP synthase mitochondrial F1 complex assembly factor 1